MKLFNTKLFPGLLSVIVLTCSPFAMLQAEEGSKNEIGVVTCEYIPGTKTNLLIHSSASFDCVFKHGGVEDHYEGEAGIRLGLDLEWTQQSSMSYSVVASTNKDLDWSTALNGTYTGGKASAAFGVKLGAAALVGGSNDSIGLVPLAVETGTGAGAAAGIGYLSLKNK
ncbi:MAG: DUF992 domain-containing protein [Gammaproteobacteria bacterium]|nr:DUF992 domain-containing protein [Gammaproteobacteria bacterium]